MKRKILVTGVGGNVGQGILKNLIHFFGDSLFRVGTDTAQFHGGLHLCDVAIQVPRADSTDYISKLESIIDDHQIELLLIGTDLEALVWASHPKARTQVLVSPQATCEMTNDKWQLYQSLKELGILMPFTSNHPPTKFHTSSHNSQNPHWMLKPRAGSGSKGIQELVTFPQQIASHEIIQEKIHGIEITSAFYYTKTSIRLGPIAFTRKLQNGATVFCETTDRFNDQITASMDRIQSRYDFIGPVNLQWIYDSEFLYLIEINTRFSGTNFIRARFGFTDVKFAIDEYLFGKIPRDWSPSYGKAIRVFDEIIHPLDGPRP